MASDDPNGDKVPGGNVHPGSPLSWQPVGPEPDEPLALNEHGRALQGFGARVEFTTPHGVVIVRPCWVGRDRRDAFYTNGTSSGGASFGAVAPTREEVLALWKAEAQRLDALKSKGGE